MRGIIAREIDYLHDLDLLPRYGLPLAHVNPCLSADNQVHVLGRNAGSRAQGFYHVRGYDGAGRDIYFGEKAPSLYDYRLRFSRRKPLYG